MPASPSPIPLALERTLASRPSPSAEQEAMVRQPTRSDASVEVVVGNPARARTTP